ncbi:hypothetical protein K1T71_010833 [Dendrolimus kikuchii]|uniref:Uncharacterized protein n=1 Tax=Dendrolimus kikuchii TaxID=765133 RepID=A0ACC1CPZ5_9NEOP|nr:hypothetical protein K1T71_010833 [Dendrolimus kikuchii]
MQYFFLLMCIVTFHKVTCDVVSEYEVEENFKVENVTENTAEYNGPQEDHNNYLDDMIIMLRNRNWTTEEETCLSDVYLWIRSLRNFTLWAVWDWDAQPSEPQGLLFGSRYQLGNFDQCMNVPWSSKQRERKTQYCLAEIVLEKTDKSEKNKSDEFSPYGSALDFMDYHPTYSRPYNELTWGACVPDSCRPSTVKSLLEIVIDRSHLGLAGLKANIKIVEPCQRPDDHKEFDTLFYAFVGVLGFLTAICIICTCINYQKSEKESNKHKMSIINAFCMKENLRELLRVQNEDLKVLYGIRFLSICFIILDHQLGISNAGPISDGYTSEKATKSFLGHLVLHDDLFVDTFFYLSGCLAFITLSKFKQLPNPFLAIFKRYIRLVVALAIVLFYICAAYQYSGTGPLWPKSYSYETLPCRKYWWLNILMLNNYIETENICLISSWYIPCDFHFTVIIIFWFWLYRRSSRLSAVVFATLAVLSIIIPGLLTYINNFSAIQTFTAEFVVHPRGDKEFNVMYIKSHTRFAAYLVGVAGGYLHTKLSANKNFKSISKIWAIPGALSAIALMMFIMVAGCTFLWRDYHPIEGAVYAALNRPAWAVCIAVLVLCCSYGEVPVIKSFLCWNVWVPLSRLAYGLYLTHTLISNRNVFVSRNSIHNDYLLILSSAVSVVFWGSITSLLIWLLAEAPVNNLITIAIKASLYIAFKNVKKIRRANLDQEISKIFRFFIYLSVW